MTDFTRGKLDKSIASTICFARANGFFPVDLANSKQADDDNSPNSDLGGDTNIGEIGFAEAPTETPSGRSLSKTLLRTVSHATRNSAKGLTEVIESSPHQTTF